MDDYRDRVYDETFDCVYKNMEYRKNNDDCFTKQELEGLLRSLYINEGNDQLGKGEIQDIIQSATIAACETVLHHWDD